MSDYIIIIKVCKEKYKMRLHKGEAMGKVKNPAKVKKPMSKVRKSYVAKLTENYKRGMEPEVLKDNELWTNTIASCVLYDLPFESITDATTVPPYLTAEKMKELANQYLDLENYVLGILKPENVSK
jgi:hypothetical protein